MFNISRGLFRSAQFKRAVVYAQSAAPSIEQSLFFTTRAPRCVSESWSRAQATSGTPLPQQSSSQPMRCIRGGGLLMLALAAGGATLSGIAQCTGSSSDAGPQQSWWQSILGFVGLGGKLTESSKETATANDNAATDTPAEIEDDEALISKNAPKRLPFLENLPIVTEGVKAYAPQVGFRWNECKWKHASVKQGQKEEKTNPNIYIYITFLPLLLLSVCLSLLSPPLFVNSSLWPSHIVNNICTYAQHIYHFPLLSHTLYTHIQSNRI